MKTKLLKRKTIGTISADTGSIRSPNSRKMKHFSETTRSDSNAISSGSSTILSFNAAALHSIPSRRELTTLRRDEIDFCLEPIVQGLRSLNAEELLELERVEAAGALLKEGTRIRPIHDKIQPSTRRGQATIVRYIHLKEVSDQYSCGIFVFPPNAKIPLHDHPGMSVVSRLLYGDMHVSSLDLLRDSDIPKYNIGENTHPQQHVKGAKFATRRTVNYLQAPDVSCLYPYEGNLHEFTAGPNGAAILDVLLPPYDADGDRDCTFYEVHDLNVSRDLQMDCESSKDDDHVDRELCLIVPTGQPEDFHCISGRYLGMGTSS